MFSVEGHPRLQDDVRSVTDEELDHDGDEHGDRLPFHQQGVPLVLLARDDDALLPRRVVGGVLTRRQGEGVGRFCKEGERRSRRKREGRFGKEEVRFP